MIRSSVLLALAWVAPGWALPQQVILSSAPRGSQGAVACESKRCSQIGMDIFEQGGTAADAMVAVNLCVGVIGMYHSGIGGGGFMLIRDGKGNKESLDYRETAPAAAYEDMFKNDVRASEKGGLAVAVPGELRGLEYLHKKHGVLPWSTVVKPAVDVARYGFEVTGDTMRFMNAVMRMDDGFLVKDPVWAEDFAPNGTLLQLGDTLTRKRYANTLEIIAEQGVDVFYEGHLAEEMVELVRSKTNGSGMTLDDLKNYKIVVKAPLSMDYRGYKLFTTEAPSSGAVTFNMLKIMEQYPQEDLRDGNLTLHRFIEAMKFAYGARMELGDPDFVPAIDSLQKQMISVENAAYVRTLIKDDRTQDIGAYNPTLVYTTNGHGTSHMVVTDASGLAISSTTTVNLLFGAQIMTPKSGIILNNEMNDFSIPRERNAFGFPPSPHNFVRPGKRPLSSITPVLAEFANGTFFFATGAAGGSRIISATAQAVWRVLEQWGASSLQEAIAAPRVHDQLEPDSLWVEGGERGWANATYDLLEAKGHNLTWVKDPMSSVQGVLRRWDGEFEAASETRQKGSGGLTI